MVELLLFVVGFALLIKSADWLVDGASSIAKTLNVPSLVVGLTVVAFGTSAPELFVTLFAQFKGSANLAIGNVLGSNVANIWLILGVAALVHPLQLQKSTVWKEIPFALLASLVLLVMLSRSSLDGAVAEQLYRSDGLILLGFFTIFAAYSYEVARQGIAEPDLPEWQWPKAVGAVLGGMVGLAVGAQWVVDGAVFLTQLLKLDQTFVGLTIVALGTSLPELATSLTAAARQRMNITIGNVVGSNIFNIFFVLGLTATVRPYQITSPIAIDLWAGVVASSLLFAFVFLGARHTLDRLKGMLFVVLYALYLLVTYSLKQ